MVLTATALWLACLSPAVATAADAHAAGAETQRGVYVSAAGGVALAQDLEIHCHGSIDPSLRTKMGYGLSAAVGYAFGDGLRLGAEASYHTNPVSSFRSGGASAPISGSLSSIAVMGDLLYDIDALRVGRFTPYVGGGIGIAHIQANDLRSRGGLLASGSSDRFAYQGIVGVSGAITPALSVDIDYRYFAAADPTFTTTAGEKVSARYRVQSVMVGGTYHFSQ